MSQTRDVSVEFGVTDTTISGKVVAEDTRFKYGPNRVADFNTMNFSGSSEAKDLIEPLQDLLTEVISHNKAEIDFQTVESRNPVTVMRRP